MPLLPLELMYVLEHASKIFDLVANFPNPSSNVESRSLSVRETKAEKIVFL